MARPFTVLDSILTPGQPIDLPCARLGCDVQLVQGHSGLSWKIYHNSIEEDTFGPTMDLIQHSFTEVLAERLATMSHRLHPEPEKPPAFPPGPCTCNTCA